MALNDQEAGDDPKMTQTNRVIAIDTPLGEDVMLLTTLDGVETISRGFVYTIEMFTLAPDVDVRTLLGQDVTLWLRDRTATEQRPLHGHVRRLTLLHTNNRGYRRWRAEVVPWFWFLTNSVDCRIFQDMNIPSIIREVFESHDLAHFEFRLHGQYLKLDFCVQYRESAFAFVSRLMEHTGIFYWFEHHADKHVLIMADHNGMAEFTTPRQAVMWPRQAMARLSPDLAEIHEMTHDISFHPGKWALKDYDFEVPSKNLRSQDATMEDVPVMNQFETFDYPGGYSDPDEGGRLARVRMEAEETRYYTISGAGSCVGFDPGRRFTLIADPGSGRGRPIHYFLTEIRHSARDPSYFSTPDERAFYGNHFVCMPAEVPFRPERVTPKPIVHGPQTATVMGPAGENIHTDQYGRVKVLFHWDRHGKRDDTSSCWIRVSQHSAGSHLGSLAIPHVEQEVVIGFLEGDPDRPIVIGHVHNGTNLPPLALPRDREKTIMRDHGDNKIVMHGKAGQQWLSAVSPRGVNLVAMRSAAKPLSADIVISGVDFPSYEDSTGYNEMFSLWQELETGSTPPDPGQSTLDRTGAEAAYTADINLLGEGKVNTLSGGNMNTWVGNDTSTWVNGNSNELVKGNAALTVYGNNLTDVTHDNRTKADNNYTNATNNYTLTNLNVTTADLNVTAAIANETFAASNNTFYLGINTTIGLGWNFLYAPGLNQQILGINIQFAGLNFSYNTLNIKTVDSTDIYLANLTLHQALSHIFI